MNPQWHNLLPATGIEHGGIIIDAVQRFLQFDTFGGVIPAMAIDLLFTEDDIKHHIEQAVAFYQAHEEVLSKMSQNKREEALRAHLCGIIRLPIMGEDDWHDAFTKLHEKNKRIYLDHTTSGRVAMLLDRHKEADIIASAVHKYQAENVPTYDAKELITWTVDAKRYYLENAAELADKNSKDQRDIICRFLAGK